MRELYDSRDMRAGVAAPKRARPRWIGQASRFVAVGIINTIVDLGVLNVETVVTGVRQGTGYAIQKGLSFTAAVICSYFLNKHWTFRGASTPKRKDFPQFVLVSILGAAVNVATATAVVTYGWNLVTPLVSRTALTAHLWVNVGALCGSGAGFVWNFLGYKLLVFKS